MQDQIGLVRLSFQLCLQEFLNLKPFKITLQNIDNFVKLDTSDSTIFYPNSSIIGEVNVLVVRMDDTGSAVSGGRKLVQVFVSSGSGKIKTTGSIENMMKQSIDVAVAYIQKRADDFGVDPDFFKKNDVFIHAPEIGVTKDGPSAGLALTIALLSAIKQIPIPQWIAVTGEMDLMGNALKIGGVKMKILNAMIAGVREFLLPVSNKMEFEDEIEDDIKKKIKVHFVNHIDEVIKVFFPDWEFKTEKKLNEP